MKICLLPLVLLSIFPTDLSAAPVLERVVMLSRHGVRAPLRSVMIFRELTEHEWPAWPVGPGEMTEHGAKNLEFMADHLRDVYAKRLLPQGCPAQGAVAIWADQADHRTRQSGEIFAQRLAPGCGVTSRHAAEGTADPLFDATKSDACPVGMLATGSALIAATQGETGLLRPEDRRALETLQGLLAPNACKEGKKGGVGVCLVPDPDASRLKAAAQLGLGSMIAEGLYLEYVQGLPATEVGWGTPMTPETLAAIMPAYEQSTNIRRRTPLLAARRGALMARAILAWLKGQPAPHGAPDLSPDVKVVMIAGHDSNLLYMASLMGLDWRLPHQPIVTAPDTTLAFEVWHDPATEARTLRVLVYAQTLDQLRNAIPLDASHRPDVVPVVPDACTTATGGCSLQTFSDDVVRRLASLCDK